MAPVELCKVLAIPYMLDYLSNKSR
jgi:hypothetical protein